MSGPPVNLPSEVAITVGFVAHELATNALKYGALSVESGRVMVAWRIREEEGERILVMRWRESGGPLVAPPRRKGFGTVFLEGNLAAAINFAPEGLSCELTLALMAAERDALGISTSPAPIVPSGQDIGPH
jgi:two-component sensor histidine kinase